MKRFIRKIPFAMPSLIIIAVIIYITLTPVPLGKHKIELFLRTDKIAHLILFFVAGCVFILDYTKKCYPHYPHLDTIIAITIFGMLFGAIIEIIQYVMNLDRKIEMIDFIYDSVGSLLAFGMCKFLLIRGFRTFLKRH